MKFFHLAAEIQGCFQLRSGTGFIGREVNTFSCGMQVPGPFPI